MPYTQPFFSLVIPCYNDGRYKAGEYLDRLLTSVVASNLSYDDIEVILADDHSPKSYMRTVTKFKKHFNIKIIQTEYQFAPGNTRQVGTMIARGKWLCFADHDDTFYPRALRTVMDLINNSEGDLVYVHADFDKVKSDNLNEVVERFYKTDNNALKFVHGKFYNIAKLWKPFHLHFPKDLKTHEDVAIGNQVECVLKHVDPSQVLYVPTPIYRWTDNAESISNQCYNDTQENTFLERAYSDYLTANIGQFIEQAELGRLTPLELTSKVLTVFLGSWFHLYNFKVSHPDTYIKENVNHVKYWWQRYKEVTHFTTPVIKMMIAQGLTQLALTLNRTAQAYGVENLDEWIEILDRKEEQQ